MARDHYKESQLALFRNRWDTERAHATSNTSLQINKEKLAVAEENYDSNTHAPLRKTVTFMSK